MGKNMLFIHGAGGRSELWTRQRGLFPGAIAINLPGHPEGEGREWIEDYASWLNEYRLEKKLDSLLLIGHSMGGAIALAYALFFPYSVKGLILMSTGASLPVSPSILKGLEASYGETVERIIELAFHHDMDKRFKEKSIEVMKEISPWVTQGDFLACNRFSIEERLEEIKSPALILVGEEDRMTPLSHSKILDRRLPNSRLEVIPGSGHMLMLEAYREVNHHIREFVQDLGN